MDVDEKARALATWVRPFADRPEGDMRERFAEALREAQEHGAGKMQDACELAVRDHYDPEYAIPVRALDTVDVLDGHDDQEDDEDG